MTTTRLRTEASTTARSMLVVVRLGAELLGQKNLRPLRHDPLAGLHPVAQYPLVPVAAEDLNLSPLEPTGADADVHERAALVVEHRTIRHRDGASRFGIGHFHQRLDEQPRPPRCL